MDYAIAALKFLVLTNALVYGAKYIVSVIHSINISNGLAWRMSAFTAGFITLQWLLP